ncbi:hypothetical protein DRP05_14580 [Archaeoglobales archaeon]|nr:MAG: hypothetical protein DRP05_14580 [Archaeoglobales archaeon]
MKNALDLADDFLDGSMVNQTQTILHKQRMLTKIIYTHFWLNTNDSIQNPVPIKIECAEGNIFNVGYPPDISKYKTVLDNNTFDVILYYDPAIKKWRLGSENGETIEAFGSEGVILEITPLSVLIHDNYYTVNALYINWWDSSSSLWKYGTVGRVYIDGELAYDVNWVFDALITVDSSWSELENNIDYFVNQYFDYYTQHPDELPKVPPSMAVKEFSQQYNQTGFPGYAAAALASMGVPCTDLNKTVTIEVNGTKLEGWMVGWDNATFEANKTYVVPANVSAYILTDDGLFMIPQGTSFKVLEIQDVHGNKLDKLTSKGYTTAANPDDLKRAEERLDNITKQVDELTSTIAAITNSNNNDWLSQFLGDYGNYVIVGLGAAVVVLIVKRR